MPRSVRERQLIDGLINLFDVLKKAKKVNQELARWEERMIEMAEEDFKVAAKRIASKVDRYVINGERRNAKPSSEEVKIKIQEELNRL